MSTPENVFVIIGKGGVLIYVYPETYKDAPLLSALLGAVDALIEGFFGKMDSYKLNVGKKELLLIRREKLLFGIIKSPRIPDALVKEKLLKACEIISNYILSPSIGALSPELQQKLADIARGLLFILEEYEKSETKPPQLLLPPYTIVYLTEKGEKVFAESSDERKHIISLLGEDCVKLLQKIDGRKTILDLAVELEIAPKTVDAKEEYRKRTADLLIKLYTGEIEEKRLEKRIRYFVHYINYLFAGGFIGEAPLHYTMILSYQKFLEFLLQKISPIVSKYITMKIVKQASSKVLEKYPNTLIVDSRKMVIHAKIFEDDDLRKKVLRSEMSLDILENTVNALKEITLQILKKTRDLLGNRILTELKEKIHKSLTEVYGINLKI